MKKITLRQRLLTAVACGFAAVVASSSAFAQGGHRGNWNTPEARSCAAAVEAKYNRRVLDRYDSQRDSERAVEITFYSVARVPHLFGGHKHVSMAVSEYIFEGDELIDSRKVRRASYCVLDDNNRVLSLEYDMR
jgi:hypothetical protein